MYSSQIVDLCLLALFGFIQNLAIEPGCLPHFELTRCVDILVMYTKILKPDIRFMSLYTLSLLVQVIPFEKQGVLILEKEVIGEYIDILTTAVSSPDLAARKVYGDLVIPADDILRLVKQLWYIEPNRHTVASFLSSLIFPLETCLRNGNEDQQKAAMDLLWTVISDPSVLIQITAGDIHIDFKLLEGLADGSCDTSESVHLMTSCVLYKIRPECIKGNLVC